MVASSSPFHPDCLQGKIALVTGGGSGIGFAIASELLQHGCVGVLIMGRRRTFLERAAKSLGQNRVRIWAGNVRQPKDCEAAISECLSKFGRLDILVNGAAGNFLVRAEDLTPKGLATVMAVDALGTFNMSRAAFSVLKGGGIIINISATLQYGATWWQAHASAAKAAVDSLTRSLALEWGTYGIRVVGIAPGPIADTPGTTKLAPMDDKSNSMVQTLVPLQRLGEAFEIGHAVVYLCTAAYVTGTVLVVDGGQWLIKGPPLVPGEMVARISRQVEHHSRSQGAPTRSSL